MTIEKIHTPDPIDYSIDQLIQCVQREIRLRQLYFPELIEEGVLTATYAQKETSLMVQVGEHLIKIKNGNIQSL